MTTYEKTSTQEVEEMLRYIDPDLSRSEWIRVGLALKSEYGEEGRSIFETWSRTGSKFRERQFITDWKAFGKGTGRPVTLGTIVHLAKMGGWWRRSEANHGVEPKPRTIPHRPEQTRPTSPTSTPASEILSAERKAESFAEMVADLERSRRMRTVARYEYSESFFMIRLERQNEDGTRHSSEDKSFCPISFDEHSQTWNYRDPENRSGKKGYLPLYGAQDLEGLPIGERVYIVEGEKCVEKMRSIGRVAVSPSHGAQSPDRTDWSILEGRSVVILPDADEDGAKYGKTVAEILRPMGCEVRMLNLKPSRSTECPKGWDIADWIDEDEENEDLGKRLDGLADDTSPTIQKRDRSLADALDGIERTLAKTHGRTMLGVRSVFFPRLDEALDGWRGFGVLVAKPNIGKTNFLLQVGRGIVEANRDTVFVFFTLEMASEEMLFRALCQASKMNYGLLRKGSGPLTRKGDDGLRFSEEHRIPYEEGLAILRKSGDRIRFVERADIGPNFAESFEAIVRSFMIAKGATRAFVVVDHLAKIPSGETESLAKDDQRIDTLLRTQRSLGEDCCIVAISESRKTDFAEPSMESAKGSTEISYSPDFMIALANESKDAPENDHPRRMKVSILKGRAGMQREEIILAHHWKDQRLEEVPK